MIGRNIAVDTTAAGVGDGDLEAVAVPGTERAGNAAVDELIPGLTGNDAEQVPLGGGTGYEGDQVRRPGETDDRRNVADTSRLIPGLTADTDDRGNIADKVLDDDDITQELVNKLHAAPASTRANRGYDVDHVPDGGTAYGADEAVPPGRPADIDDRGNIADKVRDGDDDDIVQELVTGLHAAPTSTRAGRGHDADRVPDGGGPDKVLPTGRPADIDDRGNMADKVPDDAEQLPVTESVIQDKSAGREENSRVDRLMAVLAGDRGNIADKVLDGDRENDVDQVLVPVLLAGPTSTRGGCGYDSDKDADGGPVYDVDMVHPTGRPADTDDRDKVLDDDNDIVQDLVNRLHAVPTSTRAGRGDDAHQLPDGGPVHGADDEVPPTGRPADFDDRGNMADKVLDDVHQMPVTEPMLLAETIDREERSKADRLMAVPSSHTDDRGHDQIPASEPMLLDDSVDREENSTVDRLMAVPPADRGKLADKVLDGHHDNHADKTLVNGRGVEQVAAQVCSTHANLTSNTVL